MPLRRQYVLGLSSGGFHRISYTEWGDPRAPHIVICVHGLTRNARDFDALAQALEPSCRVICPDVAGRGHSDWLERKLDYAYPQYLADMTTLLARATAGCDAAPDPPILDWVGTSMGGIIGMLLAAQARQPIRRLVINDVGPVIPKSAVTRLKTYVGKPAVFPDLDAAERYMRDVSAPFGPLTAAQWRHLTEHSVIQQPDGSWRLRYDPGIAVPFHQDTASDVDLWRYWDRIECPTLVLRGADSDLLAADTAAEMTRRGPRAKLIEFPGIGHAPALLAEDQVALVRDFLLADR